MRHVIESQQFVRETIEFIFKKADELSTLKDTPLRGKIMASLFYEPSTRTRLSFESAMLRLGGEIISTENACEFSSAAKGETLEDTIRVVSHYADIIVLRHFEQGAPERAAAVSEVPIINAGDGAGQHPTQALLDLYTIQKELGRIDGIHIILAGDLLNGRTTRSLSYLLGKYDKVTVSLVAPKALSMGTDIKEYLTRHNITFEEQENWNDSLKTADVVYMTRIQKERFKNLDAYNNFKGIFVLTRSDVESMKEKSIVMHPLPRIDEIATDVDTLPQAAYFRQAQYGVLVRMALLQFLLTQSGK
jgi:aspartate carbamoyltransferase catalytic subunit